jgi:hypothetical protein
MIRRRRKRLGSSPLTLDLRSRIAVFDFGDACATDFFELACESVRLIELLHIVTASYALADEKDVRYRPPARHVREKSLKLRAQRVEV